MATLSKWTLLKFVVTVSLITIVFASVGCGSASNSTGTKASAAPAVNPVAPAAQPAAPAATVELTLAQTKGIKKQANSIVNSLSLVASDRVSQETVDGAIAWKIDQNIADPFAAYKAQSLGAVTQNPDGTLSVPVHFAIITAIEHLGNGTATLTYTPNSRGTIDKYVNFK